MGMSPTQHLCGDKLEATGGAVPHSQKRKKRKIQELEPQVTCSLSSLRGEAPTARQVLRHGAE